MRKTIIHIEVVPVEEAVEVLKQQALSAKRNGNGSGKLVVRKSRKAPNGPHTSAKKPGGPAR